MLFLGLLPAVGARAKSNSWWDCFFREFELCQGRDNDPDAPAEKAKNGVKTYCDGKARTLCDEEEAQKSVKLSGHSANEKTGKASTIQFTPPVATPSKPDEILRMPDGATVEGRAPSGDNNVLGVDVTLPISGAAEAYKARNIHGCRPLEDAFSRKLCLNAPGATEGTPVELEYYRGRLAGLSYDSGSQASPVRFRSAVSVAEEKTGAKATFTPKLQGCLAQFALGGGTLTLLGSATSSQGSACDAANLDAANLIRVEWAPSSYTQREIEAQRKADGRPALQEKKKEEVDKAKELLPL
ncbi:MAG: hypothetical protein ACXVCK_05710 [Bdellovibrionota bacterium]